MNDVVIHAKDLKKVYRLYSKPSYRFRDMFGLLGNKTGAYTEHAALDGIDLEIRRGEKVAVIGRNGAGKSTFLKLVTGVIQPTAGTLDVHGKVQALLQIGTGFHPDFTGRDNVYAYLAQLGIVGEEARQKCRETVEFAEIEDYIDQPIKTYSTGMGVRLMFAASTVIRPELLVLDEVLGVGDAYFTQKSYGRIREMCDRDRTTLLLVTHDIYSAMGLCTRVVWIDRGHIVMDDVGPTVVKAYEDSIRQQEEVRLRARTHERVRELTVADQQPTVIELYAQHNHPQPSPIYVSRVELFRSDRSLGQLPLQGNAFDENPDAYLQREGTCWGDPIEWVGRLSRPFLNYGSSFHKVAGVFSNALGRDEDVEQLRLEVDYWTHDACDVGVRGFFGGKEYALGRLVQECGRWATYRGVPLIGAQSGSETINQTGRQGSGIIGVTAVRVVDESGSERHQFHHGERFSVLIGYQIRKPEVCERAQVMVSFHQEGLNVVCRTVARDLLFDARRQREGIVEMVLDHLPLPVGKYSVTVMVAAEHYFDRPQATFYSINPDVYASLSRVTDIVVNSRAPIASAGVVCQAAWRFLESSEV